MPSVRYNGGVYTVEPGTSVLDTLLSHGVEALHSCKAGTCGSCVMRATDGTVPQKCQSGLKESWKVQGYFLPCVCQPESDLAVTDVGAEARCAASITHLERLSGDVLRVRLGLASAMEFRAGQYVTLLRDGQVARSYSIASLPGHNIEMHVRRIVGGRMSGWLHDMAQVGDEVQILGPYGECFYVPGSPDQPLLLAGTGTGLAPLYGILLDALRHGHTGPIRLFHGAVSAAGLYLVDELNRLAAIHPNVEYTPTVLNGSDGNDLAVGPIDSVVLKRFPKLNGWRAYVCGDLGIVKLLRKKIFLAGAASRDIYADAFLPAAAA